MGKDTVILELYILIGNCQSTKVRQTGFFTEQFQTNYAATPITYIRTVSWVSDVLTVHNVKYRIKPHEYILP